MDSLTLSYRKKSLVMVIMGDYYEYIILSDNKNFILIRMQLKC